MPIPTTCSQFVSHPHLIDGRNCYTCVEALCSEEQGTSQIAEELIKQGISCDVHQTGGYTMCVYIKTGEESFIYANAEGFGFYINHEDYEPDNYFWDEFAVDENAHASEKAGAIIYQMKIKGIKAQELGGTK